MSLCNRKITAACPHRKYNRRTFINSPIPPDSQSVLYYYSHIWMHSLDLPPSCVTVYYFTQFTLNHFTPNILQHQQFCGCYFIGSDSGELCLTEQPLALLQSWSLTAVFFHLTLLLVSALSFRMWTSRHAHTRIQMLTHTLTFVHPDSYLAIVEIHSDIDDNFFINLELWGQL